MGSWDSTPHPLATFLLALDERAPSGTVRLGARVLTLARGKVGEVGRIAGEPSVAEQLLHEGGLDDATFARLFDEAGVDVILVGDSAGMVVAGESSTLPVTMDESIYHCRAVARGAKRAMVVGDMPFMSYQVSIEEGLRNAGRLPASAYRRATLYSTLSPCDMCSGAVLLYKIPRVIVGENRTFRGPEQRLRENGVELLIQDDPTCIALMEAFQRSHPELWNEDIGE